MLVQGEIYTSHPGHLPHPPQNFLKSALGTPARGEGALKLPLPLWDRAGVRGIKQCHFRYKDVTSMFMKSEPKGRHNIARVRSIAQQCGGPRNGDFAIKPPRATHLL